MIVKATKIDWDAPASVKKVLPKEIEIPEEVIEQMMEIVSDYITDEAGFCHNGFKLELSQKKTIIQTILL